MNLIPLGILAALTFINLGIAMANHGKKHEDNHNFWVILISVIISWGLILWAVI